ncbi:hypothetical protein ACWD25_57590 [Streptomyces sp. NPDC002920]
MSGCGAVACLELCEASQHTDIKAHTVAEPVIDRAPGQQPLPQAVSQELGDAAQRRSRQDEAPDQPQ